VSYGMVQRRELFDDPALVRLDHELAGYVRDASPEVPATLVDRIMASISEERVARAPLAFIQLLAAGSLAGASRSFREVAHAAFGQRIPILVRLQAMALMALVSLFLGATVALAALGAVELLRVAQPPAVQPPLTPSPGASVPIPGQPGVYPGATVTPLSSPAPRAPASAPPAQPTTAAPVATPPQTARPGSTPRAGATRAPAPSAMVRPRATATPKRSAAPLPLPTATPRVTRPPLPSPPPLPPLPTATPRVTLPPLPLPSLPLPLPSLLP
jgi:hypothetical protein